MRSAVSSMRSMQSSSDAARLWMSSRSKGVMNELFTLLMSSCVASSAECSSSLSRSTTSWRFAGSTSRKRVSSRVASTRSCAEEVKREKKLVSWGVRRKPTGMLRSNRGLVRGRCYGQRRQATQSRLHRTFTRRSDAEPRPYPWVARCRPRRTGTAGAGDASVAVPSGRVADDGPRRLRHTGERLPTCHSGIRRRGGIEAGVLADAEELVDLGRGEVTRAAGGGYDEVRDELDLVPESDIEQV